MSFIPCKTSFYDMSVSRAQTLYYYLLISLNSWLTETVNKVAWKDNLYVCVQKTLLSSTSCGPTQRPSNVAVVYFSSRHQEVQFSNTISVSWLRILTIWIYISMIITDLRNKFRHQATAFEICPFHFWIYCMKKYTLNNTTLWIIAATAVASLSALITIN